MQARRPIRTVRRPIKTERSVFDQKWLTYLLTFILILLIAIFVLSFKYQDWMVDHVKKLLIREKPPPPKPRPRGRVGKREGVVSYQLSMDMKQHPNALILPHKTHMLASLSPISDR